MSRSTVSRTAIIVAAVAGVLSGTSGSAAADSPPASWTNVRTMTCDGATVDAAFTPGGVFTSFHVLGSSDVIVPKRVEVVPPGGSQSITTLDVPGFDRNSRDVVTCQYVDPAGLAVTITGIRS
jgi:hypothetical protein